MVPLRSGRARGLGRGDGLLGRATGPGRVARRHRPGGLRLRRGRHLGAHQRLRRVPVGGLRMGRPSEPRVPRVRRADRHRRRAGRARARHEPGGAPDSCVPTPVRRHRARRPARGPGPARRPRGSGHVRPRRDRRRVPHGSPGAAVVPAPQPDRTRLRTRRARRACRGRRATRWPGRVGRGARAARLPRPPSRAVRERDARSGRPHRHGDVGLEGVEPRGAEVRPGRAVEPR